ncbi:cysteine--tRNA ligase [Rickettsiales endosymbiont of Stachyamoeba lipophora]|uniref:cysteine--tRNA ligase n=1 Tax=Rickettsiales endosymbiont of Stachyamoeba lipophora TaxID=2486578 RepID=UPI000F64A412|nr:cysteine--tRNA ligase [Rickettsiales endosymbiont of Stachyamoeba lipophora]AZL15469.1 cysteine--tRNA ligase [Rickettsiales endosymbiont of Stachyamoeba lipophora]
MKLKLYNTLSQSLEEFKPQNPNNIGFYACGPTVYDHPHIGNARSAIIYDLLFRVLRFLYDGEKVIYVRNITDIDDKIIARAAELNISTNELTEKVTQIFNENMSYLGCLPPTYAPKATEHLAEMFDIIQKLLNSEHAYYSAEHVYFNVASFKDYTKLSNRNLNDLIAGSRVEISEAKKHPGDFVLWKPTLKEEVGFDSPFGFGRPGWHIECSAMSYKYLGTDFDIHGGGADLIFPHHTNEIAQSCCAFPGSRFAKVWVHNGFLTVNGEKMSKSLGNFITVSDMYEKGIEGASLRLALLSTHYRKPLDFTEHTLESAQKNILSFRKVIETYNPQEALEDQELITALSDDLNTPEAFAIMHKRVKENSDISSQKLLFAMNILGLNYANKKDIINISDAEIAKFIIQRADAKKNKNFIAADQIRDELKLKGVILEDTKDGTKFYRV